MSVLRVREKSAATRDLVQRAGRTKRNMIEHSAERDSFHMRRRR